MVPDLDYNLQGTFREGVFYDIGVPLYPFQYEDWDDSWCFSLPDGMNPGDYQGDEYFRLELANTPVLADFVDASLCPLHFQQKLAEIEVEVHDGPLLDLINCDIWIAMKKSLRRILEEETCFSGLKPIKPKRITHFGNEYHDNGGELFDITVFEGRIWETPFRLHGDFSNKCRQCGFGPLYCDKCGYFVGPCPVCKAVLARTNDSKNSIINSAIIFPEESPECRSLLGKTWDGMDFCMSSNWVITKRVLDWLLLSQVTPFYAKPIKVCVDGMTSQQLEWLCRAAG